MLRVRSFRHCEGVVAGRVPRAIGVTLDVVLAPLLPYMYFFTGHRTCHRLDISGKTTGPSPLVAVEPL